MSNSDNTGHNEHIHLSLPVNAAYVSAARLTVSSVANRMGFSVDEIEDIKTAVSEACTFIIKKAHSDNKNEFKISLMMDNGAMEIQVRTLYEQDLEFAEDDMCLTLIRGLVESFEISKEDAELCITLYKKHMALRLD